MQRELPPMVKGGEAPVLCWGLASFPEEVGQPEMLYAAAVEAMRASRSGTPGEVVIYRGGAGGEGD
jgi:hypothetical protein